MMGKWEHTSWGAAVVGVWGEHIAREVFDEEADRTIAIVGSYEDAEAVCAAQATIADLRDRLRVLAEHVCHECGCAPVPRVSEEPYCWDCSPLYTSVFEPAADRIVGACISVGLRALCGRRILEGC